VRVSVENLACSRGGRRIFSGLSFTLTEGETLLVTGRNGAGKSTLLALLAERLAPDAGTMRVDGVGERQLSECLHLVGHRDALKGALTAAENLAFARDLLGAPALDPQAALAALGLEHAAGLPVAYLSAGQRRRVALARLLVADRPLWLLDEPTAALDAGSQKTLVGLMNRHLAEGGQIIVATHQALPLQNAKELRIERQTTSPRRRGEGFDPPGRGSKQTEGEGEGEPHDRAQASLPPHPRSADAPLASPAGPQAKPSPRRWGRLAYALR